MKSRLIYSTNCRGLLLFCMKLIHFLVGLVLFSFAWILFRYDSFHITIETGFRYNVFVILGYGVCVYIFGLIYNVYLVGYSRVRTLILAQGITRLSILWFQLPGIAFGARSSFLPCCFFSFYGTHYGLRLQICFISG